MLIDKKIIIRIVTWVLLIAILSVSTLYIRKFFITGENNQIVKQERQLQTIKGEITAKNAQIKNFSSLQYDNNFVSYMIPTGMDTESVISDYIMRPISVVGADLITFNLSNGLPGNLTLAKTISGEQITVSMKITDITQFQNFIDELYSGVRLVYFGNFNYTLPGENANTSSNTSITVTVSYYLFYYNNGTTS